MVAGGLRGEDGLRVIRRRQRGQGAGAIGRRRGEFGLHQRRAEGGLGLAADAGHRFRIGAYGPTRPISSMAPAAAAGQTSGRK